MMKRLTVLGAVVVAALAVAGGLVFGTGNGGLVGRADAAFQAAAKPGAGEVTHVKGSVVTGGQRKDFDIWRLGPDGAQWRSRSQAGDKLDSDFSVFREASGAMVTFSYDAAHPASVLMTEQRDGSETATAGSPDTVGLLSGLYTSGTLRELGRSDTGGREIVTLQAPPELAFGAAGPTPGTTVTTTNDAPVRLAIDAGTLLPVRLDVPETTLVATGQDPQRFPAYSVRFDEITTTPIDEIQRRDLLDLHRVYPHATVTPGQVTVTGG